MVDRQQGLGYIFFDNYVQVRKGKIARIAVAWPESGGGSKRKITPKRKAHKKKKTRISKQ